MSESRSLTARMRRTWAGVRTRGLSETLAQYLRRKGIRVVPFHYVMELLPTDIPGPLTNLPEGFEYRLFGAADIATLAGFHDRGAPFTESTVRDCLERGYTCVGVIHQGELVAYTWFAVDAAPGYLYPVAMQRNEAFLFNMFVEPAVRGRRLAPILRYQSYKLLRTLGRDTFYSITLPANRASWRFKQKLNAQRMFLGVYVNLFGKFERRWILRRY